MRQHVLIKSRIEYVDYACNYVEGCSHGCRYCYARTTKRVPYPVWRYAPEAVPFAVALLEADLNRLKAKPEAIMVSSSHDPCQPGDDIGDLTEDVLSVLADRDMPAWVLTKGGLRSWRYLDLLKRPGARLGVTITTHDEDVRHKWEPGAASIHEHFLALVNAKLAGVETWVSVEPVLPGLDIPLLARQLHGLADWVVIGKWNYSQEAKEMDWIRIQEEAEEAFSASGIPYLVKRELHEAALREAA